MADTDEHKKQRDRFLAFAFASADLFLEISQEGTVLYALGASKGITGFDDTEIIGKKWLGLFSVYDQAQLLHLYETSKPGKRCGPLLVELNDPAKRKAVFTGIKMPGSRSIYITLGLSNLFMSKMADALGAKTVQNDILNRTDFLEQAQDTLQMARSLGQNVDMTMFDFAPTEEDRRRMGEGNWNKMLGSVESFLQSQSIDGNAAAAIADGRYTVIHEKDVDGDFLRNQIQALAQENDPTGTGIEIQSKTLSADLATMSERDTARALVYTINEFERKGTDLTIENLNSSIASYASANVQKIKEFQSIIQRLDFSLFFQPIIDLNTLEVSHYEMLTRFTKGDTLEWIMFGEDMGMAPDFDIAVCERAINYISFKGGGARTKFAINLSGQSVENDTFYDRLQQQLAKGKDLSKRIMFEITESSHIRDLDKVNRFVEKLQAAGYKIALDDFGAGSASFEYIQKLKVDMVKIDGKYIRKLLTSDRDAAMVKNLTQMCKDLGMGVVAEYVEEQAQANMLRDLGIDLGQGYFFGKPESAPTFQPPHK
ncbi:MAG: EAL domain-containing protein [Alphaproteobacteria bacterium]|nr:EAL domain-containing protein [Alphaproteobacteria bacterium]